MVSGCGLTCTGCTCSKTALSSLDWLAVGSGMHVEAQVAGQLSENGYQCTGLYGWQWVASTGGLLNGSITLQYTYVVELL